MLPSLPSGYRGIFRQDDDARQVYSETAGIERLIPSAVACPRDADDLRLLCAWASAHAIPLTPRGNGSSMTGAALGPGVVVDLSAFRNGIDVDPVAATARVGAAHTCSELNDAAGRHGMRFPVDPSSAAFATIGGMIGTNAAGAHTLRFGAMRPWVHALECVFIDGSRARLQRGTPPPRLGILDAYTHAAASWQQSAQGLARRGTRKDSSGYGVIDFGRSGDLIDLMVGSEGTLAFVTAAEVALIPQPAATASVRSAWDDLGAAVRGAALAREAGAVACELLDASFLEMASRAGPLPVPSSSQCVLLTEFEGDSAEAAGSRADAWARTAVRAGASSVLAASDARAAHDLWALRHAASPILSRLDPHIRSMQVIEDGCVPPERLGEYVLGVREVLNSAGLPGVVFGHAGDAHLHVNALVDVRDSEWRTRVRVLHRRGADLVARLGGTPSGEHGDGRLREAILPRVWEPSALALFSQIKRVFDANGLLNPGIKTGMSGDPFQRIKYDPSTPLPSARARRVLDLVEADRAYHRSRLEMLDGNS